MIAARDRNLIAATTTRFRQARTFTAEDMVEGIVSMGFYACDVYLGECGYLLSCLQGEPKLSSALNGASILALGYKRLSNMHDIFS